MTVSAKGKYALKIMTDLARHRLTFESVSAVAARQNISPKYAEQIMAILKRARFVESTRGATGGYRLAGNPEQYRVGDVLRLIEGQMETDVGGDEATARLWRDIEKAVRDVIDSRTIADLIR